MSLAVAIRGATKRFGPVVALDGVDLEVEAGTIHALVGENGAGKTTLVKALYGASPLDSGTIQLFGSPVRLRSSAEAIRAGVGMVSQHYAILPELTSLQNLVLGAEEGAMLSMETKLARAEQLARGMGYSFDWDSPARDLTPSGAQRLEILRLLWRGAKLMILDEPTAMLSPADGEALFGSLRSLIEREGATVILVTHRLPEVFDHCEGFTVLRGGEKIAAMPTAATNPADLARLIVGGDVREGSRRPGEIRGREVALEVRDLTVSDARGTRLQGASFSARAGDVVGIAGVDGNGQRELFRAILGVERATGSVRWRGEEALGLPVAQRLARGVRLIAEDRLEEAAVEGWSLVENAALGGQRRAPYARRGLIQRKARVRSAGEIADRFGTRRGSLRQAFGSLSGGNQQRFVAARALADSPGLILAFQPARGLDLNSTVDVYNGIRAACDAGATALVVSFELDELLTHCDRIVVLSRGRLEEPASPLDREEIARLMVGAS